MDFNSPPPKIHHPFHSKDQIMDQLWSLDIQNIASNQIEPDLLRNFKTYRRLCQRISLKKDKECQILFPDLIPVSDLSRIESLQIQIKILRYSIKRLKVVDRALFVSDRVIESLQERLEEYRNMTKLGSYFLRMSMNSDGSLLILVNTDFEGDYGELKKFIIKNLVETFSGDPLLEIFPSLNGPDIMVKFKRKKEEGDLEPTKEKGKSRKKHKHIAKRVKFVITFQHEFFPNTPKKLHGYVYDSLETKILTDYVSAWLENIMPPEDYPNVPLEHFWYLVGEFMKIRGYQQENITEDLADDLLKFMEWQFD